MSATKPKTPFVILDRLPDMELVASSYIHAIGFDGLATFVQFKNKDGSGGPMFRYATVGAEQHEALAKADSVGRHFLATIRGKHAAHRVVLAVSGVVGHG